MTKEQSTLSMLKKLRQVCNIICSSGFYFEEGVCNGKS